MLLRCFSAALIVNVASGTEGIAYAPINVWPYPQNVDLPDAVGPHRVADPDVSVTGCDDNIQALLSASMKQRVYFRETVRSYDEKPYEAIDALCPAESRCMSHGDCGEGKQCFSDASRRYNSTHACAPSAPHNAPCGCCASSDGPPAIPSVVVRCDQAVTDNEEGYTLNITSDGIVIEAMASRGAGRAIATLSQLLRWDKELGVQMIDRVPVHIADAPAFSWRGMMLDTSRNFLPLSQILELIDGMYAAKLNIFHWHIVDTPSFPFKSDLFPELANEGSWSQDDSTVYSVADVQAVLARAKDRFVEVVMEFDTPAHTMSWGKSHPEIMTDCWEWLANSNPKVDVDSDDCMAMDPTAPAAEDIVTKLLGEVISLGGDASRFLHLGGDEVKVGCWNASERIRSHVSQEFGDLSEDSFKKLQLDWTRRLAEGTVVAAGKVPVIWQPTGAGPSDPVWDPKVSNMPNSTIYMAWLSSASVVAYAEAGSQVVNTEPFYIAGMGAGGWKQVYDAEVAPSSLKGDQRALVLGGQICMWGETFGEGNFEMRAYQIGMGAAENFWGKNPSPEKGKWALQQRFNRFLCHLRNWDIVSPPQMPSFCGVDSSSTAEQALLV